MIRLSALFAVALFSAAICTSAQPERGPGDRAPAAVTTEKAPKAIGPYSQAIKVGRTVYCSGQIAINPATQNIEAKTIEEQTKQVLENLKAVLEAAGSDLKSVVKTTVYLKDMNNFAKMNEIYATYFPAPAPARATVEVARLPKDAMVEIECTAVVQAK